MFFLFVRVQEVRAHHQHKDQQNEHENDNNDPEHHHELAKKTPDDTSHQQNQDKHHKKRHNDRYDHKTDLLHPKIRHLHQHLTALNETRHVLGHHDRVVDDEARRDRQHHEEQVIERISKQVHHAERPNERERHD